MNARCPTLLARRKPDWALLLPRSLLLILPLGACDAGAPTCDITPPTLVTGRLHIDSAQRSGAPSIDGGILRDELGRVAGLRGVNAGSRSKFAPYLPFDFTDSTFDAALADYLDRLQRLGVDVLRVPFAWAAVEPTRGTDDPVFLRRYDALLDGAWRRGMRTIVDFHQDVYAEIYCGDGFPAWTVPGPTPAPHHDCPTWYNAYQSPAVLTAFDRFWATGSSVQADYLLLWQRMAQRHAARPGVIGFEPINEPSAGTQDEAVFETQTLYDFYSRVAGRINQWAPGALVFLDPPGLSSATRTTQLPRPMGRDLVFAPHYYQPLTIFGGDARPEQVLPDLQRWAEVAQRWGAPWFLGEWGAARAADSSPDVVAAHHAQFDALGIGGAQWEYSLARELWNAEPLDLVDPDGTPTPMVQGLLRPHARAVAGAITSESFDRDSRSYTLRYRAIDAGVTEIVIPAAQRPAPTRIEVSGGCYQRAGDALLVRASGAGEVVVTAR